jgi:hypothetical protein
MDPTTLLPFPLVADHQVDRDLVEIDAAIALVARGLARRVCLVSLSRPEDVAALGLAHAQAAHVPLRLDRAADGAISVTVGPRP